MQNDLINPGLRAGAAARSSSEREAGSMQSFHEDCYPSRRKVAGTGAVHGSAHGSMHVFPPVYDDHARSHRFDVPYSGYDPQPPNVMAAAPPVNLPLAAESDHTLNYGMMGMRVKHPRTRAHSPYRYTGLESSTAGPECMQGQEVLPHHFPFPSGKHTFGSGAVPELPPGAGSHHDALTELARENIILKHQLNAAAMEVERLKHTIEGYNHSYCHEGRSGGSGKSQSRYWTEEEHQRFLDAIQNYGHKDVKAIAQVVGTRSATQVRTHAQKYFIKLARSRKESQSSGKPMQDTHSNPDQEDMADDPTEEEMSGTSMEAAAAAAAAAWEAGTSAAAAAAYVAASQSKSASKKAAAAAAAAAAAEDVKTGSSGSSSGSSNHGSRSNLVSSNVHSLHDESIKCKGGKNTKTSMRGRKRSNPDRDGPGTPGSMGSSNGSLGSSDATGSSTGNGSNGSSGGSNGVRSSDTTNGGENGSSNGSNSNGCNENGSSGDPGSSGDSGGNSCGDSGGNSGGDSGGNSPRRCRRNNGVSSNDGSDHGFFDTGEEGEPFSDELVNEGSDELVNEGSDELANEGGSSEEGYLENALSAGSPVAQTFR